MKLHKFLLAMALASVAVSGRADAAQMIGIKGHVTVGGPAGDSPDPGGTADVFFDLVAPANQVPGRTPFDVGVGGFTSGSITFSGSRSVLTSRRLVLVPGSGPVPIPHYAFQDQYADVSQNYTPALSQLSASLNLVKPPCLPHYCASSTFFDLTISDSSSNSSLLIGGFNFNYSTDPQGIDTCKNYCGGRALVIVPYVFNNGLGNVDLTSKIGGNVISSELRFRLFELNDSAPVPEPSSWALIIAGLGVVGAAMRRRMRQLSGPDMRFAQAPISRRPQLCE